MVRASRQSIVDAAARAFAKRGLGTTTIRDIAREAGCSAPVIYHYFDGKQDLVDELVATVHRRFLALFEEPVPASLSFPQRLELLLVRQLALAERHHDVFSLFMAIRPGLIEVGTRNAPAPSETQVQRLAQWFQENCQRAEIGGLDHREAARFLASIAQGFMVDWVVRGGQPGALRRRAALILRLFFGGVGPARAPGGRAAGSPRPARRRRRVGQTKMAR